jgi:transposase
MRKRYPSDVTDAQWERVAPIFEAAGRGRPRQIPAREIVDAILYVMKNGCTWRALPHDFPTTVGIIDSTFIESAYGGAQSAPNGYKRATGHGVHVLIDKHSQPLAFAVLAGNLQAAAGARGILPDAKRRHPTLHLVLGDKAYRQRPLQGEIAAIGMTLDGDSPPLPKGTIFRPMPMRWRIEQFFACSVNGDALPKTGVSASTASAPTLPGHF